MDRMEAMLAEIRAEIRSLRSTIIVTAISSVLATVLGISATNAALYANMRATFETGKETAVFQAQVVKLAEETIALAKKMEAEKKK